mgnify:CR=1 FL=1
MLAEHLAHVYDDAQNATLIQNRRQTIRRAPRCAFTSVTANASLRPCQRLNQHSRRDPGTSRWPLGIGVWAPRTTRRRMTSPHGAARPRHGSRATRASKLAVSSLSTGSHVTLELAARAGPGKLRFWSHGRGHPTLDGCFFSY